MRTTRGLGHAQLFGNAAGADIQMRLGDLIDGQQIAQMGCCQFHTDHSLFTEAASNVIQS